jgi:hypothetical protein
MDNEDTNFRDHSMKELDYDSNIYDYEGTMTQTSNPSTPRTGLKHSISVHMWVVLSRLYPIVLCKFINLKIGLQNKH